MHCVYMMVYDVSHLRSRTHQFKFNREQRTPSAYCCGATFRGRLDDDQPRAAQTPTIIRLKQCQYDYIHNIRT